MKVLLLFINFLHISLMLLAALRLALGQMFNMQIQLRERDLNAQRFEALVDGRMQIVYQQQAVGKIGSISMTPTD